MLRFVQHPLSLLVAAWVDVRPHCFSLPLSSFSLSLECESPTLCLCSIPSRRPFVSLTTLAMAASSRPSSPLLPAFGIRDLNGPRSQPGLVQITARQYDSTIRSEPDAALSYIDLDDGELITVGSSFELRQRLDEPVLTARQGTRSNLPFLPPSPTSATSDKNKVHIFDIRHTSSNLAVWRDHEAWTSKTLKKEDTSSSSSSSSPENPSRDASASSTSAPRSTADTSVSLPPREWDNPRPQWLEKLLAMNTNVNTELEHDPASKTSTPLHPQDASPVQMDKALGDVFTGLQSHLGPLADFLEGTATGLRKLAEKTAEADTTPVETILTGFKTIVTEVGRLGIDFLATLDEELEKNKNIKSNNVTETTLQPESLQSPPVPSVSPEESTPGEKSQLDDALVEKRVSFADMHSLAPPPLPFEPMKFHPFLPAKPVHLPQKPSFPQLPASKPSSNSDIISLSTTWCPGPVVRDGPQRLPSDDITKASIIDSQPADSEVLIRYPPLPSLRKAASVSGLQSTPGKSARSHPGLSTTSALSRYPSIGQFEEQRRLKSKDDSEATPKKLRPLRCGTISMLQRAHKPDIYQKPTVEDMEDDDTAKPSEATIATFPPNIPTKTQEATAIREDIPQDKPAVSCTSSPPGAWPDQKPEELPRFWSLCVPREAPVTKPTADVPSQSTNSTPRPSTNGLSHRVSSPVDFSYKGQDSNLPKRSQTISGTNPAARLNGPFDPLAHVPLMRPRAQVSQPDLSLAPSPQPAQSPIIPGAFPRRSQTVHHTDRYNPYRPYPRPASWDNYLKNNNSTNTLSSAPSHGRPYLYPDAFRRSSGPAPGSYYPPYPAARPPFHPPRGPAVTANSLIQPVRPHLPRPALAPPTLAPRPAPAPQAITKPQQAITSAIPDVSSATVPAPAAISSNPYNPPTFNSTYAPPTGPRPMPKPRSPETPLAAKSVDECVKTLKAMGFGSNPHEMARLNVYAGATAGDVAAAIEMIEEDREGARELDMNSDVSQVGSERDVRKDFEGEDNPWGDRYLNEEW